MRPRNPQDASADTYDFWTLDKLTMPERSYLYALQPIRWGSADVESLSSYIVRLAWAHGVRTTVLLRDVILPTLHELSASKDSTPVQQEAGRLTFDYLGWTLRVLNGQNDCTHQFIMAVEYLTGQTNLMALSMLTWADVVPPVGLLFPTRRWCPKCYAERREHRQPVYDKLIWSLRPIMICSEHQCLLEQHCPHCGMIQPSLPSMGYLHQCAHCGHALTTPSDVGRRKQLAVDEMRYQRKISALAGNLLVTAFQLSQPPDAQALGKSVSATMTPPDTEWLARRLAVNTGTVQDWLLGRNRPQIESFFNICLYLRMTPQQIFVSDGASPTLAPRSLITATPKWLLTGAPHRHKQSRHDEARSRQALEQAILSRMPTPLMQVAKSLGCSKDYLTEHFPELSKQVVERYRALRASKRIQTVNDQCERVRQETLDMHLKGAYPSRHKVAARVGTKMLFADAFHVWQDLMRELGYREKLMT